MRDKSEYSRIIGTSVKSAGDRERPGETESFSRKLAACWPDSKTVHATSVQMPVMGPKEGDDNSSAAGGREREQDKSRFTIMLVVLVNAFLFSTCFFMGNSILPVSIYVKFNKLNIVYTASKTTQNSRLIRSSFRLNATVQEKNHVSSTCSGRTEKNLRNRIEVWCTDSRLRKP